MVLATLLVLVEGADHNHLLYRLDVFISELLTLTKYYHFGNSVAQQLYKMCKVTWKTRIISHGASYEQNVL